MSVVQVKPALSQTFQPDAAAKTVPESLLASLFAEFLNSCLLTATAASAANAAIAKQPGSSEQTIVSYLPPSPSLFPQVRLLLCMAPRTCAISILLSCYYDRLAFLRDLTRNRSAQATELDTGTTFNALARAWCMLAADAIEVFPEFEKFQSGGPEADGECRKEVVDLLEAAQRGRWPCVDAYGKIDLPLWAERRASQRTPRNLQAFFMIGDGLQRARVIDVSRSGLCVQGLDGVGVSARVYLLLAPGRSVGGTIMWCKDGRVGIELDGELPEDCQLRMLLH